MNCHECHSAVGPRIDHLCLECRRGLVARVCSLEKQLAEQRAPEFPTLLEDTTRRREVLTEKEMQCVRIALAAALDEGEGTLDYLRTLESAFYKLRGKP